MFKRLIICLILIGAPHFVAAQNIQDGIVSQLQAQGFSNISASRTWLGRVRVVAFRDDLRRELVFNPQTGEILRDYWQTMDTNDTTGTPRLINPGGSSGSGSSSGDDDNNDDDSQDDEKDDDEPEDDDQDDRDEDDSDDDDSDDDKDEEDD